MNWVIFLLLDAICIISPDEFPPVVLERRVTANTGIQNLVKYGIYFCNVHIVHI